MQKMPMCLILNGPPGSGKDTIADRLVEYGFTKMAFKDQLYVETAQLYDVALGDLLEVATDRELKEKVWERTGVSPRQMLITCSEEVIKPRHGKSFFGDAAAQRCVEKRANLAVFSDGGFKEEIVPLREVYEKVIIVRLRRPGFTFEGDSRTYLCGLPDTMDLLLLESVPERAVNDLVYILDPFLGGIDIDAA